jgi:hypothetical protein
VVMEAEGVRYEFADVLLVVDYQDLCHSSPRFASRPLPGFDLILFHRYYCYLLGLTPTSIKENAI